MNKIYRYLAGLIPLMIILYLGALSGCTNMRGEDNLEHGKEVTFMLNIKRSASELVLRADAPKGETSEEKQVTSMYMVVYNEDLTFNKVVRIDGNSRLERIGDTEYRCPVSLTGGSNYHIAVVANLDVSSFTGSIEELKHKALTSTTLPATPLTMFGETDVENVQNHTNIMVHIQRSVFAVDITSNANDSFELLDEWYLMNGEASGYLQEDNPESIAGFISKPTDSDKLSTSQRAYSYPRTTSDHSKQIYVIFKGKYQGQTSYYRVPLNVVQGEQSLKHGRLYRINITKVIGVGYSTKEEAIADVANKTVVFTVADWDDTNNSETAFFDGYYITSKRINFEFDAIQQQSTTDIYTNAPSLVLIPPYSKNGLVDSQPQYANWATLSLNQVDRLHYRLNVGVFQNNDPYTREAFAFIRAEDIHTADLKLPINILQRTDEEYYSRALNMDINPYQFYSDSKKPEEFVGHVTLPIPRQSWSVITVEYYIPGKGYVGKGEITDELKQYDFIESVSTPGGEWVAHDYVTSVGEGDVKIKTREMDKSMTRFARILVRTGGENYYEGYITITQDFTSDYTINYPNDYHNDIKRSKYVIETDMYRDTPSEFHIDITSNSSWSAVVDPVGAESWIKLEPNHFEYTEDGQDGNLGFALKPITTHVKVTVQPNEFAPYYDYDINEFVYPQARKGGIIISYHGNERDILTGNPLLTFNQSVIDVYQGGYVEIDGTKWLDRNLKTGYLYSQEYDKNNNTGYRMLYPYANPIGLSTNVYGAYSKDNNYFAPTPNADNLNNYRYGDDGLFPCGGSQSGYYRGSSSRTYRHRSMFFYRDGRFRQAEYYCLIYTKDKWDKLIGTLQSYPTYNNELNPCPPGWTIPSNENLKTLVKYFKSSDAQSYGKPTTFPWTLNKDLTYYFGKMGVNNSGWVSYFRPMTTTSTGEKVYRDDSWYVPFFLPAAGSRLIMHNPATVNGTIGYYKQNEKNASYESDEVLIVTPSGVLIGVQNVLESSSVRCVKKN